MLNPAMTNPNLQYREKNIKRMDSNLLEVEKSFFATHSLKP
jgi:hypothetical protein